MNDEQSTQQQQQPEMPLPPPPSGLTPSPPGGPSDSFQAGPAPTAARRRPNGLVVGALVLVLAVIAGVVGFTMLGGEDESANAQPLALAFTPGQSETYTMHMTMDGQMSAGELLGGDQPLTMEVTQVVTWEATSIDDDGVATITVTVDEMSGTVNGIEIPSEASATPPVEIQIAPDGRILSAGGMSFAGLEQTGGASFPGMGQMTPLLPDGPVEPGDTWSKDFSQDIPFGEGTIEFTATSTLEGYEEVDGVNAAVITTEYTVPMDFTIDFGELMGAVGATGSGSDLAGFEDASIAYSGQGSFEQTAWVDTEAQEMLKMTSSGSFDMSMEFSGLEIFEGQSIGFTGDFTQELTRG
jgi:hypothetical protein